MPKMKTHSGSKKRFSLTAKGKVKAKRAWTQHRMVSKEQSAKMRNRGTALLSDSDAKVVKRVYLPNAR